VASAASTPDDKEGEVISAEPVVTGQRDYLGRYENLGVIKKGGMGVIYRARDPILGRTVALKMMKGASLASQNEIERFLLEARSVAQLKHDNIVKILDYGQLEGQPYFTMEVAERGSLHDHLEQFQNDPRASVSLMVKVARAVHHVHEHGIVHRDLKPANILLEKDDKPVVSDFGLVKWLESEKDLTQPGNAPGTPAYMAPEQFARPDDLPRPHIDIWALGVILFELLTGQKPFSGPKGYDYAHAILAVEPPRPRSLEPRLHYGLETIVLKCLDKNAARRYASAAELADDLERWLRGEPILGRRLPTAVWLWRRIRKRSALVACVLLVVCAAIGLPVLIHYIDPDRTAKVNESKLAKGEAVALIPGTGPPSWSRWVFGQGGVGTPPEKDGTFYLHSYEPTMLELQPAPLPPRYWFRAQVRQSFADSGEVGIYLLHRRRVTSRGVEHCYAKLTLINNIAPPPAQGGDVPPGEGEVRFSLCRTPDPDKGTGGYEGTTEISGHFPSRTVVTGAVWRSLAVRVTPETAAVYWDGELLGSITRDFIGQRARFVLAGNPELQPKQEFPAEGGLGLFVKQGGASFCHVGIEPIHSGE
jgi:serine/threonine-protein kinase